jgi:hypothetical protein
MEGRWTSTAGTGEMPIYASTWGDRELHDGGRALERGLTASVKKRDGAVWRRESDGDIVFY